MIKVTVGRLRDPAWVKAFADLLAEPDLTIGQRWDLAETALFIDNTHKKLTKVQNGLVDKYLPFVLDPEDKKKKRVSAALLPEERREAFASEAKEINAREVELPLKGLINLPKVHGLTGMTLYTLAGNIIEAPFKTAPEEESEDESAAEDE